MKILTFGLATGLLCSVIGAAGAADAESYKILRLDGNNVRWQPVGGKAPVISYAIAAQPMEFPGARNCQKLTAPDELLAASALTLATFRSEVAAAFSMWQMVADIQFREAESPAEADIVLGAQVDPTGHAFADVFYDARSRERLKPISKALVCLNPAKAWKIGFNGDLRLEASTASVPSLGHVRILSVWQVPYASDSCYHRQGVSYSVVQFLGSTSDTNSLAF